MPYGFAIPVTISTGSSYCVELLPRVQVPTLVLRCRHDNGAPFEQDRLITRSIARAKFVTLESDNHVVLAGEPAWPRLISEIAAFLIAAFLAERGSGRKHARLSRYAAATRSASFLRA
jgi:pimeloyl-ACP methyl ester carboxylesterase